MTNFYKIKCNLKALEKAINESGGIQNLATKTGVSYQTVLNWKSMRTSISPINCVRIEEATDGKVKREDILPGYPWEELR